MNWNKLFWGAITAMYLTLPTAVLGESPSYGLWARPYVPPLEAAGMIPESFKQDASYGNALTREEFAELIMGYIHRVKPDLAGSEADIPRFEDTENAAVIEAYRLKVIEGVTDFSFQPATPVNRAQAVVIIYRMENLLDLKAPAQLPDRLFKDDTQIPPWAKVAISSEAGSGIFSGYEDGTFRPENQLTEEQGLKLIAELAQKRGLIQLSSPPVPPVAFTFSKSKAIQGDAIEVTVENCQAGDVPFVTQGICEEFQLQPSGIVFKGTIPTDDKTPPGLYWVEYGIQGYTPEVQMISVLPQNYKVQELRVSRTLEDATRTEESYREFHQYFKPVRKVSNPEKYYTEGFVLPVSGRLTTEFGESRRVNDEPTTYRHSGWDIAAPLGTSVHATNRGKVVFSTYLILTGNTLVIDHGAGLFSVYYHLSERLVEKDALVERGENIGKVGSTGFSTAPHLHFTLSHYSTNIEPGLLLFGKPITKGNYQGLFK